jgi:hypothetical protein
MKTTRDNNQIISSETEAIRSRIYLIRAQQVMLDKDIAALYEVKPIRLREQVQRNIERFPDDFMFQLSEAEVDFMVSQNAIPSRKHLGGSLPFVFTEQGVASLAGVLRSAKAAEVHVKIMRAFVEMRRFIQHNANLFFRLDSVERRQIAFESETEKNFEKIFKALETGETAKQGIFFNGQVFDAWRFASDLVRKAKESLVVIDNYVDDSVLTLLSKRSAGVSCTIYTKTISKQMALDLKKHNQQYQPIVLEIFKDAHDRFLIIDESDIYHMGASLKDLGKKWFAFSKFETGAIEMLKKLEGKNIEQIEKGVAGGHH